MAETTLRERMDAFARETRQQHAGAAEERAKIVAYLMREADLEESELLRTCALQIEAGDHDPDD
jgi:hypothetical protein